VLTLKRYKYGARDKKILAFPHPFLFKEKKEGMKETRRGERKAEQRSKTHCRAEKDGVSSEVVKHCTFFKSPPS
jgi:hypothetical protein